MEMINLSSEVIKEFFMQELVLLMKKYEQLDEIMVQKIEMLLKHLTSKKDGNILNIDDFITMANQIPDEYAQDEDFVEFYFSYCDEIQSIEIDGAAELYKTLIQEGYVMNSDVVIYSEESYLESIAEDKLDEILDDSYEVERLISKESLAYYFAEDVSKTTVARELLETTDAAEILGIDEETLFESEEGVCYKYGIL